jgi:chaperonin GroEL
LEYTKAKPASKLVLTRGPRLREVILATMKTCSDFVGSTLGPGGMSVIIERQEEGFSPLITKDGITALKSLGFADAYQQSILESARDAVSKTAASAGDGTSTSSILSDALIRNVMAYTDANPKVSPQRVMRALEACFKEVLEPTIKSFATKLSLSDETRKDLLSVAKVSANGDKALAKAVLDAFDICGDDGNVTLLEASGHSGYEVEHLQGYPIGVGYEESCAPFHREFINDEARQLCTLTKPYLILYHGRLNDIYNLLSVLDRIHQEVANGGGHNVLLVATGFSETVMAHLAGNFKNQQTLKIYPLKAPLTQMKSGQMDFLQDLAALSGGTIFDPLNAPLDAAQVEQLGTVDLFEASRFRSSIVGFKDELLVLERVDQLRTLLNSGGLSELDATLIKERLAKVTGGIARLKIIGASAGELREKRDRAEDAICSVRAAIAHGGLPGGGWTLMKLQERLKSESEMLQKVLIPSFQEPLNRLYTNSGYQLDEVEGMLEPLRTADKPLVYDILEGKYVCPFEGGILDSVPAVLEALRNSLSIAAWLGTCGGLCVFARDREVDRQNAKDTANWLRDASSDEANERF